MSTYRVYSNIHQAASQTLGQASRSRAKARGESLHNRRTPRISAVCERGEHYYCFSLNCTCSCGHGRGQTR